ncbi:MAG: hypothetical protein O2973_13375 [Gemmatimonadetes bacterium]|nr:hypothetical protein [Gemmatimonadota bacterium]
MAEDQNILPRLTAALAGRYEIVRELGRGGMATVYLATDVRHEREVAIKVLLPELAATLGADRFEREIKLAGRLQHPHILGMFDSGAANGLVPAQVVICFVRHGPRPIAGARVLFMQWLYPTIPPTP